VIKFPRNWKKGKEGESSKNLGRRPRKRKNHRKKLFKTLPLRQETAEKKVGGDKKNLKS